MGGEARPLIVADIHELASGIPPAALRSLDAHVEIASLATGDYVVSASTAVERRTAFDLQLSLVDGRFRSQINTLKATYASPFLLVEGTCLDVCGYAKQALRSMLLAVIDEGVTLVRSEQAVDSARCLLALARRRQRRSSGLFKPAVATRMKPLARPDIAALAAIPSISPALGQRLLDRFGSVAELCKASPADLQSVAGIGPMRSRQILRALHSESNL